MAKSAERQSLKRALTKWSRLTHIYLSMFGLLIVLFFAVTGFTLNHTEWFGWDESQQRQVEGSIAAKHFEPLDKLMIVESLRKDFQVRGAMTSFDDRLHWAVADEKE